jgi:hypothetical protein
MYNTHKLKKSPDAENAGQIYFAAETKYNRCGRELEMDGAQTWIALPPAQ